MRPASAALLAAVRGSHRMVTRARVAQTFQTGTNPVATEVLVLGGDVQVDGTADIRSTVDLTTDGTSRDNPLLAPYGNELFVERGVDLGGAGIEWVSLGYFRINAPEQQVPPDGPIRIQGADRMAGIIDARLLEPRQYTAAQTYGAVMADLVTEVYPAATITWDDTTNTTAIGRNLVVEQDRYKFLNDLVTSVGKIWYWNHRGELTITDTPDPGSPVYDITHGDNGVLVSMVRHLSREGVYNAVVATGEAADNRPPVRAVATDDNPDSPTRYSGPFGPVPRYFSSPLLTSADEIHILQRLTVPLTAATAMRATTKEQTTIVIGVTT
jgi:hypothetical protein